LSGVFEYGCQVTVDNDNKDQVDDYQKDYRVNEVESRSKHYRMIQVKWANHKCKIRKTYEKKNDDRVHDTHQLLLVKLHIIFKLGI
jgi:hypothetical protein